MNLCGLSFPHVREPSCLQRSELRTQHGSSSVPESPWHRGHVYSWAEAGYPTQSPGMCVQALQETLASTSGLPWEPGRHAPAQLNLASLAAATVTQSSSDSHQTGLMRAASQPNLQEQGIRSRAKLGPYHLSSISGTPRTCLLLPQDPSRRRLQHYVPFAKGSGQTRGMSPLVLREPEPEKRHGSHFGVGPPHSPKFKVRIPLPSVPLLTITAMMASRDSQAQKLRELTAGREPLTAGTFEKSIRHSSLQRSSQEQLCADALDPVRLNH